jgi:formylglycine-generating enzyme
MCLLRIRWICALSLLIASSASAVTMAWTPIGNPGNGCDPQSQGCFGGVGYAYSIGTYEVTNAQYAEFLNAKAQTDQLSLYNTNMGTSTYGGISRSGSSGSYTYNAIAGRGDMPVNFVSFYDALRFANWMSNGQATGDTETGSYTLLGGTSEPTNGATVTRNPSATIVLTSENEWYKAAYYDMASLSYFDYPAGSNTQTTCATPSATANTANCQQVVDSPYGQLTPVGSYTGSTSPYGTFDQGGNVSEWNEAGDASYRGVRGGEFDGGAAGLAASYGGGGGTSASNEYSELGFRLTIVPEPGTGLLVMAGLLGLAGWRRPRT